MAETNVMKVRLPEVLCECGNRMEFLDSAANVKRRRIVCREFDCKHYGIQYYEPLFPVRDPAMELDDGSL